MFEPYSVTPVLAEPAPASRGLVGRIRLSGRKSAKLNTVGIALVVLVTVLAVFAPLIAPHSPVTPVGDPFEHPFQRGFLFGTDQVGRDILSRSLIGLRASWFATLWIVAATGAIGAVIGTLAGLAGGLIDSILMRITDFFLALPGVVVAIVIVASLGPSIFHAGIALVIVAWPYYARLVRSEVRATKARPFAEAAAMSGISRRRLVLRHLLPGVLPVIVVTMSMDLGGVTIAIALLSFLGLGVPAPAPELGSMVAGSLSYVLSYWWVPVLPAVVVFAIAFVANLAGDGVRERLGDR